MQGPQVGDGGGVESVNVLHKRIKGSSVPLGKKCRNLTRAATLLTKQK